MSTKSNADRGTRLGFFSALKAKLFKNGEQSRTGTQKLAGAASSSEKATDTVHVRSTKEEASKTFAKKNEPLGLNKQLDTPIMRMHSDFFSPTDLKNGVIIHANHWNGPTMNAAQLERFLQESVSISRFAAKQKKTFESSWARARGKFDLDVIANAPYFSANVSAAMRYVAHDAAAAKRLDADPRLNAVRAFNEQSITGIQMHNSLYEAFHCQPPGANLYLFKVGTSGPKFLTPGQIRYAFGKPKVPE